MVRFIVSLYVKGEKRPSDCLPDFYETRQNAQAAAEAALEIARDGAQAACGYSWIHRYTIKKA